MLLYHYRPYRTALTEIEKQTLYFADYKVLNDPMEGYVNVVWQGDGIAWSGLLRNYICSLDNVLSLYLIQAGCEKLREHTILRSVCVFDDVPYGNVLKNLGDEFLKNRTVIKIIQLYGTKELKCSKKELQAILRLVHFQALSLCIKDGIKRGIIPEDECGIAAQFNVKETFADIPEEIYWNMDEKVRIGLIEFMEQVITDRIDTMRAEKPDNEEEQRKAWKVIVFEYPAVYTEKIVEMIHPHMYLTCFSAFGTNSAMWGNYAENHSGICLIYETKTNSQKESLPLKLPYAFGGDGEIATKYQDKEILRVRYENEVQQINFFTMLGTLSGKEIGAWLLDEQGNRSCCIEKIYINTEEWRKNYWECLRERYCRKMKDWAHEEEYRILLPDAFGEFEKRCVQYSLDSLKGIIFGIKIESEKKYQTIRMIKELCLKSQKKDFMFYQAEHDTQTGKIKIRELHV